MRSQTWWLLACTNKSNQIHDFKLMYNRSQRDRNDKDEPYYFLTQAPGNNAENECQQPIEF